MTASATLSFPSLLTIILLPENTASGLLSASTLSEKSSVLTTKASLTLLVVNSEKSTLVFAGRGVGVGVGVDVGSGVGDGTSVGVGVTDGAGMFASVVSVTEAEELSEGVVSLVSAVVSDGTVVSVVSVVSVLSEVSEVVSELLCEVSVVS